MCVCTSSHTSLLSCRSLDYISKSCFAFKSFLSFFLAYDHLEYFMMYEFCMVPHGQPFTEAAVDDWIRLQKSGELRLEAEGDSVVYVNRTLDDVGQSTFLRFVKIGLDGDMARYAHDTARYNDLMLRKVPF